MTECVNSLHLPFGEPEIEAPETAEMVEQSAVLKSAYTTGSVSATNDVTALVAGSTTGAVVITICSDISANANKQIVSVLLKPQTLQMLDFPTLVRLNELCREIQIVFKTNPESCGLWNAHCISFCNYRGLYSPYLADMEAKSISDVEKQQREEDKSSNQMHAKVGSNDFAFKYFHSELWLARKKWTSSVSDSDAKPEKEEEFKIKVACRFRPGKRGEQNMNLPLHQFLKLKRKQNLKAKTAESESANDGSVLILVGESDPVEFTDPFLGTLMRDPVMLKTSSKILERSIALQSLLRNGKDPFNGQRFTQEDMVPQPDLAVRIHEWKEKKREKQSQDLSISAKDVKESLIDASAVDPALLEILAEAEKLQRQAEKTEKMARRKVNRRNKFNKWGELEEGNENENQDENGILDLSEDDGNVDTTVHESESTGGGVTQVGGLNELGMPNNPLGEVWEDANPSSLYKTKQETARVLDVAEKTATVSMHVSGLGLRAFHFNTVFDKPAQQGSIYAHAVQGSVAAVLNGYNSSILCYGQTGSGKTHTFFGPEGIEHELERTYCLPGNQEQEQNQGQNRGQGQPISESTSTSTTTNIYKSLKGAESLPPNAGLAVRAVVELLQAKEQMAKQGINMGVSLQYAEVYEEAVTDLLTGEPADVKRESGDLVRCSEVSLDCVQDAVEALLRGQEKKHFAETAMNARSSRSHSAIVLLVTQAKATTNSDGTDGSDGTDDEHEPAQLITSRFHLVDLAGSERVKKSKVTGTHLNEAVGINKSLLVLGKCIAALVEGKSHVPYLESKLTTLLRAAFGGNSRTTAIVCARADDKFGDETLQSLRFGERCSMISNKTKTLATSAKDTLMALDQALVQVRKQLQGLEQRGKTKLASYIKLANSLKHMESRRAELSRTLSKKR